MSYNERSSSSGLVVEKKEVFGNNYITSDGGGEKIGDIDVTGIQYIIVRVQWNDFLDLFNNASLTFNYKGSIEILDNNDSSSLDTYDINGSVYAEGSDYALETESIILMADVSNTDSIRVEVTSMTWIDYHSGDTENQITISDATVYK